MGIGVFSASSHFEIQNEGAELIPYSVEALKDTEPSTEGLASWYDYSLEGAPNYSQEHDTCASRDFPRGASLLVTAVEYGKTITCRVNDYGPEKWTGRIIDLSSYSFSQLAPLGIGEIKVEILNTACSCIKSARSFGVPIPYNTDAEDLEGNARPRSGALALFSYPATDHVGVITDIDGEGFWIKEGNARPCEVTERFIKWNDPALRGFHEVYLSA